MTRPCGISPMILMLKVDPVAVSTDCLSDSGNIVREDDLRAITNVDRQFPRGEHDVAGTLMAHGHQ